jgi:hypothetical protein
MLDHAEKKIVDDVARVGWSVMTVAPLADSDDPEEWFAYTIGLQKTFGWPEIICFGLATDAMVTILNNSVDEIRSRGLVPTPGMELTEVLNNHPARLVTNDSIPFNYLGFANWFAAHAGMSEPPAKLQLIWPDKNGHFPDDPQCVPEIRQLQTPVETE